MPNVLVVGSANVDFTVRIPCLPGRGETVTGGEFYRAFGGKGANQAVAARRAGADVRFIGKIGRDPNGESLVKHLEAEGVQIQGIIRDDDHPAGVALITVDHGGENMIAVAPGSNWHLNVEEVRQFASFFSWADVVLVQLEIPLPAAIEALVVGHRCDVCTVLNPAPARHLMSDTLRRVDVLTPNERELAMLTNMSVQGPDNAGRAAQDLVKAGVRHVVVTLGGEGACLANRDGVVHYPPVSVDAVDTTAAGDAFNGALACVLAGEMPLERAVSFANAAGAVAVAKKGAHSSLPTRDEIERLLRSGSSVQPQPAA
jgi:ribokinase